MAARAVHTRVVDRVPPADRVSPPPAPASVRLTPLCHTQSQTERSSLPRLPPPPPPSRHLTGAHCAYGASFNRMMPAALCGAPPPGAWRVCLSFLCSLAVFSLRLSTLASGMTCPTSLPACREPTRLGAASLDRYSDTMHSCSVALLRPGSSRPAPITCLLLQFPLGQHSARRVVDSHLLPPNLAPAPTHRVVFTTTYT